MNWTSVQKPEGPNTYDLKHLSVPIWQPCLEAESELPDPSPGCRSEGTREEIDREDDAAKRNVSAVHN